MIGGVRLSPQQKRLWALLQAGGMGAASSFTAACELSIRESLDRDALAAACSDLVRRHEILRTSFRCFEGLTLPLQVVEETARIDFEEVIRGQEIDLECGPWLSVAATSLSPDRHAVGLRVPALCSDAAGMRVLARDLLLLYRQRTGAGGDDPGEAVQYADLSEWLNEVLEADESEEGRLYWRGRDLAALIECGMSRPRPSSGLFATADIRSDRLVDTAALSAFAAELSVEPENVLLACWLLLLALRTGSEEVLSGVLLEGRDYEEIVEAAGVFARVVPLRVEIDFHLSFRSFVQRAVRCLDGLKTWQECFDWDLLPGEGASGGAPRFCPFGFEVLDERPLGVDMAVSIERLRVCGEPFEVKLSCAWKSEGVALTLEHDHSRLGVAEADRLLRCFLAVLDQVLAAPDLVLGELDGLSAAERHLVVRELNDTAAPACQEAVHHLFERVAAEYPDRPAVTFDGRVLSYRALDRRADQLAACLREEGIGPGDVVPLILERSPDIVVALLAVLKAGAGYAPLDPSQPAERLGSMLAGLAPRLAVSADPWAAALPPALPLVHVDREPKDTCSTLASASTWTVTGEHLACVIFTSGSTGRPKGVAVEHRQLLSYVDAILDRLGRTEPARFGMVSTFAADLGHTMLFPALLSGGCLDILPLEKIADPAAFAAHFSQRPVDLLKIVPSHLRALLSVCDRADILPRRVLVLGGEALSWDLVEHVGRLDAGCTVLNHYGPTETTVGVLTFPAGERTRTSGATVPIGRPLARASAHVLDGSLRPVPPLVAGEIFLGGGQVSRGYIGQPEATAERFLPDPFASEPGSRLYRTGDLGRRLADGSLEFLGRVDHQVKIRGFRIEPGEIEALLARHPSVRQALVVARPQEAGPRLEAYLTLNGDRPTQQDLREHLARALPEYMIPATFVLLDSFPLNANGKIDRRALPEPDAARLLLAGEHVAPRTPIERVLAAIWCEVLGLPEIGIQDNFFELGGDSILMIRVAARAHREGLSLLPRQMFEHQTIASLAAAADASPRFEADQGAVEGPVPLTPIQCRFFDQTTAEPHHWNQSVLLELHRPEQPVLLSEAVRRLVEHHDALRLRFVREAAGWSQRNAHLDGSSPFLWLDLSALPVESWRSALEDAADQLQRSLDLTAGPLLRVALFDRGGQETARLLVTIHHLAVDGVSWSVLLEDLELGYRQLAAGRPVDLPVKTTSFGVWARRLLDRAGSDQARNQLAFWLAVPEGRRLLLPADPPSRSGGTLAFRGDLSISLDAEATSALTQEALGIYHASVEELLLTALARALRGPLGDGLLLVDLEGHGREPLFPEVDLSRTVGWFTTIFPAWLGPVTGGDPARDVARVKEQLRALPARGIDFGILRYLSPEESVRRQLGALPSAELRFNFLGRVDGAVSGGSGFRPAREAKGTERSPSAPNPYLLDLVAWVSGGCLRVSWAYDAGRLRCPLVEELASGHLAELRTMLQFGSSLETPVLTPSDFPEANLTQDALDNLLEQLGETGEL